MEPRIISIGRAFGEGIEAMQPLVPIIFALLFARALPWILGSIANG